ncbi:O-succinylbenzoate synthase [Peribacillus deserti]|uniref:o-succinylbenzoate synthase n=1 Tax=Peribacillus deserti TaxID=673318 RepID=A0ABS2QIL2_9BACI|nr:o-succinylbenzoate synthase [Peribacillus deserti]MBM7692983.1 O-succinylbenzoate synthase [Peribacillus deserti]
MKIKQISLYIISAPLNEPFITHLETVTERAAIIVEAADSDGFKGYGEVTAFASPWYTEETLVTAQHMLKDFLIPALFECEISNPKELEFIFKRFRRNNMAKSGLEQAVWDLYAKQQGVSLSKLFGGTAKRIPSGAVVTGSSSRRAIQQIEDLHTEGYQRYKIKISRTNDTELLRDIRRYFPDLPLMADANSDYTLDDINHLKTLDEFRLLMLEQPLAHDDIAEHSLLQEKIKTPLCLDESIHSFQDAKGALLMGSCRIINIKMSRVGGWIQAKKIHDLCYSQNIPVWCGGMVEFGVSRAHNIALASLPGFTIAGDISSSSRYWEEDIIDPEVKVVNGWIAVPEKSGIGFGINERRLLAIANHKEVYKTRGEIK